MGKRDRDREQHIALARTRARKEGANVPISTRNAEIDYERTMKAQRKKERKTRRLEDLLHEPSVESHYQHLEHRDLIEVLLRSINYDDRVAIVMHFLEGYKQREIAEAMGVIPARIHQRIVKGISRMKETLQRPGRSGKIAGSIK